MFLLSYTDHFDFWKQFRMCRWLHFRHIPKIAQCNRSLLQLFCRQCILGYQYSIFDLGTHFFGGCYNRGGAIFIICYQCYVYTNAISLKFVPYIQGQQTVGVVNKLVPRSKSHAIKSKVKPTF